MFWRAVLILIWACSPVHASTSLAEPGDGDAPYDVSDGAPPWMPEWQNTVAICAVLKDEPPEDVIQFIRYHRWIGVDRIFLTDDGSQRNIRPCLQSWIDEGYVVWARAEGSRNQMPAYAHCIRALRADYSWIAFIDLDEMIVVREDGGLKALLRDFRFFPGLSMHWLIFGADGHDTRPESGGMLQHYTDCQGHSNSGVKTIANTFYLTDRVHHPHNFHYKAGGTSVNELRYPLIPHCFVPGDHNKVGPCLENHWNLWPGHIVRDPARRSVDRVALLHYATRSWQDFEAKMARGGGATPKAKGVEYWYKIEALVGSKDPICEIGLDLYEQCCAPHAEADRARASRCELFSAHKPARS